MKLLVDNQLPPALARYLAANGWECSHVADLGLDTATDTEIWNFASAHSMAIVTKDQDFKLLADAHCTIPPQVIWVRLGNCRRLTLFDAFQRQSSFLRAALDAGRSVIEIV